MSLRLGERANGRSVVLQDSGRLSDDRWVESWHA